MSQTIYSSYIKFISNIIPGNTTLCEPIILNIDAIPGNTTTFVIYYGNTGLAPTGQKVTAYSSAAPFTPLPMAAAPAIDSKNKTLTIIVAANCGLKSKDQCRVEFEVEIE